MEDLASEALATIVAERFGDSYGGVINAEPLRAEARSRANEAAYLADAIQSLP
ncbi:MAG TPA: hypothetical protein VN914_15460 [Polyangia bacterium]|nr:hypothetical protein [Polyangia bacterium]